MIGISIEPAYFLDETVPEKEKERLLAAVREKGAESVEFSVRREDDPDQLLSYAERIWKAGMRLSVHGWVRSRESAVDDVFLPLARVLPALRQEELMLTVHPKLWDNAAMLRDLVRRIEGERYPMRVALENLRKIPGNIEGDCTPLTLAAVEEAESEKVGVCFDMGHFQTHVLKNCPDQPELLPSEGFYKRVIHTHIHGMKGIGTHYPLGKFDLPNMAGMFAPLKGRYTGIWNIELSPSRFAEYCDAETGYLISLRYLTAYLAENGF